MKRIAVFAGSFDPWTVGHHDVAERAAALFDELIILVAENKRKKTLFTLEERRRFIEQAIAGVSQNMRVAVSGQLTVDFMKQVGASYLVRGIRNAADLDWERSVAFNNKKLYNLAETVFLFSAPEHEAVSSGVVRELLHFDTSLKGFVPESILENVSALGKKILCSE